MEHAKRIIWVILLSLPLFVNCTQRRNTVVIEPHHTFELDYPMSKGYEVILKNRTDINVEVAVLHKSDERFIRGFGLGPNATVNIFVERNNRLLLNNHTDSQAKIVYVIKEPMKNPVLPAKRVVHFQLINSSEQAISLVIPAVMNPNLLPQSSSGVSLEVGQDIFYSSKAGKKLLYTVHEDLEDGDEIDVAKLLLELGK